MTRSWDVSSYPVSNHARGPLPPAPTHSASLPAARRAGSVSRATRRISPAGVAIPPVRTRIVLLARAWARFLV